MVRTAPTMVKVSSRPSSENTPTVIMTSCSNATMAPTANESSKRNVTKIRMPRMPRPSATKELFASSPPTSAPTRSDPSTLKPAAGIACMICFSTLSLVFSGLRMVM